MNYRRLALLFGVSSLALAGISITSPSVIPFRIDSILVSAIGVLALYQAIRVIRASVLRPLDEAVVPDPELPIGTPTPGDEFESVLSQFRDSTHLYTVRSHIHEGLFLAAIAVLTQYGGYSESEAVEQVKSKTWTDNKYAAAFLADEKILPPLRSRLRNMTRRESNLQRDIRHTVDAIATVAGVTLESKVGEKATAQRNEVEQISSTSGLNQNSSRTPQVSRDLMESSVFRESHSTGHWNGVSIVALVGIGVGVLTEEPAVLLAGVVGIGFAAYANSSMLEPGRVSIDRTLSTDEPEPAEEVTVTVTISNESGRYLPDVRVVDGVPEALAVTDGSPRFGTVLRPDESDSFEYDVRARRGVHHFEKTVVVGRDLTSEIEQEQRILAESSMTCLPSLQPVTTPVPLRKQTAKNVGRVETENGGEGIEFHSTRDYRYSDPLSRIDWNRRARTGELTTVNFRQERSVSVLLLIDTRKSAYVSSTPHARHAVDRTVDAAGQLFATLVGSGNQVGLASFGSESCWLAPGSGVTHTSEARDLFATHPAFSPTPNENSAVSSSWQRRLRTRLSSETQIIFLSPLVEQSGPKHARRFDEYGHPVTVLSPDSTADRTPGHRLARVARSLHVSRLRSAGIPVIDWQEDESLDGALARHVERWSE